MSAHGATHFSMTQATAIRVIEVRSPAAIEQAWALRRRVFIEEQHVPEALEMDDQDAVATHVLALDGDLAVGCGRMVAEGDHVKIGRMAVTRERRGEGIGRRVLDSLMELARQRGFRQAILHAQLTAEGFYLKQGYVPRGDVFEEAGIAHRLMDREL
jgi:predicted GNAT family N-acyltransferase